VADSKTYGANDPAFTWTYSGFITGQDADNVTINGAANCTRTSGESVAGGPYTITCAPGNLSAANYSFAGGYPTYDVAPDDSRFVMIRSVAPTAETELVLIQNWAEELKARAQ